MNRIPSWLVAIVLAAAPPALTSAAAIERADRRATSACQPEMLQCLEKLKARLPAWDGPLNLSRIEQSLLELNESDPECALLLRGASLPPH